jgi:hypothetical protein
MTCFSRNSEAYFKRLRISSNGYGIEQLVTHKQPILDFVCCLGMNNLEQCLSYVYDYVWILHYMSQNLYNMNFSDKQHVTSTTQQSNTTFNTKISKEALECLTLKLEALQFFRVSNFVQGETWRNISEDCNSHQHCCENINVVTFYFADIKTLIIILHFRQSYCLPLISVRIHVCWHTDWGRTINLFQPKFSVIREQKPQSLLVKKKKKTYSGSTKYDYDFEHCYRLGFSFQERFGDWYKVRQSEGSIRKSKSYLDTRLCSYEIENHAEE